MDEPASARFEFGTTTAYGSVVESPESGVQHAVALAGLLPGTNYHYRVTTTDVAGNAGATADATFMTPRADAAPVLDLWYGEHLVVGDPGLTQPWVNLLGRVTDDDGLTSFTYRVNGGNLRTLSIGPDHRRLQQPGDFNADVRLADLRVGDNVVDLTAVDRVGTSTVRSVVVRLSDGPAAAPPLMTQWNPSAALESQAQPVDGRWQVVGTSARSVIPGYDRVLAVGDLR